MLPGPPRELRPMFTDTVAPMLPRVLPLASGFVIWLAGMFGTRWIYRKSRAMMERSRYAVALAALAVAAFVVLLPLGWLSDASAQFIGASGRLDVDVGLVHVPLPAAQHSRSPSSWEHRRHRLQEP